MMSFLLRLLGVDPASVPADAEVEWIFTHPLRSGWVFLGIAAAAAAVYAVTLAYRRERTDCPPGRRAFLAALRSAVVLLLLLVFLGPALNVIRKKVIRPQVVVLLDESLSMSICDDYKDTNAMARARALAGTDPGAEPPARADVMNGLLRENSGAFLAGIAGKGHVRVLAFSENVRPLAQDPEPEPGADAAPPTNRVSEVVPVGPITYVARSVQEALRLEAGRTVGAIVLVSDGQSAEGGAALQAAETAARQRVPIFCVGVGEAAEPPNWKVDELWIPESVFRGDPFAVQARVRVTGADPGPVSVELLERRVSDAADDAADMGRVVERRVVEVNAATGVGDVALKYTPGVAGDFLYTLRVPKMPAERILADNAKSAPVKVLSEQARVLLVAGSPTWEYRLARNLLIRDKTVDVSCWLQSMDPALPQEGDTRIERLPGTAEEWFRYDVLMFFDPDPRGFGPDWVALMERYLNEQGGGLFWMAGPKFSRAFFSESATAGLAKMLPVMPRPMGATEGTEGPFEREWPLKPTADGLDHAILRFHEDPQVNRRMLNELPGVFWSHPVEHRKAGSVVHLVHSDARLATPEGPRPLLATGQYGAGRTLYMGFDGSWRWRRIGEKYFDRWWIQAVRYCMEGRLAGGRTRGRLGTDRDVYAMGERVLVTARLFDPQFRPLEVPALTAHWRAAGKPATPFELRAVAGAPGRYTGAIVASDRGGNELRLSLPDSTPDKTVEIYRQFTVEVPRAEFADPRLNRALLRELCERTGGKYFEITDAQALPQALPDRQQTLAMPSKPVDLWDTNRLLLLVVLLLSAEWALRKQWRML